MIAELKEAIRQKLKNKKGYISNYSVNCQIIALLVLKYLCDHGQESYVELIKKGVLEKWTYTIDKYSLTVINLPTSLLALIQYANLEDMLKECLTSRINMIRKNGPKLAFCSHFKLDVYDPLGNTTYIIDKFNKTTIGLFTFKFWDLVLGNNNQYLSYNEINWANYEFLYVYDRQSKYNFMRYNERETFNLIWSLLIKSSQIEGILDIEYNKISTMTSAASLLNKITKIILCSDDTTFIYFQKSVNDKISIINWHNESSTKLEQIIKLNRQQKDVLVKVTREEIKQNNYRIGFKLYQTKMENENKSINELVDENTKLIDRLAKINKDIELELNKLINK